MPDIVNDRAFETVVLASVVLCLDEWHGSHHCLPQFIAHIHFDLSPLLMEARLDVSHRNVLSESG